MFFQNVLDFEQGGESSSVKVVSVWTGMIDTNLQDEARNANKDNFASVETFKMIKDRGMLASPSETAEKLIELLLGNNFIQGSVVEELY
jgi:benzil reductase ((S)-benzoin forming)